MTKIQTLNPANQIAVVPAPALNGLPPVTSQVAARRRAAMGGGSSGGVVLEMATRQWESRPADQRFPSLEKLHEAVTHHREASRVAPKVDLRFTRIESMPIYHEPTDDDEGGTVDEPVLVGQSGVPATFTHYAFGQFCRRLDAPASFMRQLPPSLVATNLNYLLETMPKPESGGDNLLFTQNGNLRLRAVTSQVYKRIWNSDVTSRLIRLTEQNPIWQPAPAAFDGSRGLYASDEDMFAFLVDNNRRIFEKQEGGGLSRGFFVWNSEVGAASFGIMTFLYEWICGNHRVWGVQGIRELRLKHVGKADTEAFNQIAGVLVKYADGAASQDELKIEAARKFILGKDKEAVLDAVFNLLPSGVASKQLVEDSYDLAVEHEDWYGNPNSAWGFTGGMTEIARDVAVTSERVALERAAAKILDKATANAGGKQKLIAASSSN